MIKTIKNSFLLLAGFSLMYFSSDAQNAKDELPKGWHLKDSKKDGYQGISLDQAYEFVKSKNNKSKTVIVAVIDSGIDTTHEDLKPILWKNKGEIPGNGIDDDKNGYVDDVNGWDFFLEDPDVTDTNGHFTFKGNHTSLVIDSIKTC